MAFKLELVSDVKSFLRGTADVGAALEDVAGSLDDVARDAATTSSKVGRELGGVESDATDAATTLERKFRTAFDSVETDSKAASTTVQRKFSDALDTVKADAKTSFKSVGDTAKDESHRAGEATSEFKDEARQNFGEIASSFSGDMSSATDLVQGTLGGLAGSMAGPVGLALGGLSILGGAFAAKWQEAAAQTEQRISDMYDDMLASGADFVSKDYIAGELGKIYKGADDAIIKVGELRAMAEATEIAEPLLARALVGDKAAREQVATEIARKRLAINEALDDATAKGENLAPALAPAIQALQDVEDKVSGTAGAFTEAQRNANAARDAIAGVQAATSGVAQSAEDARAKFDGLGRPITTTITAVVDTATAEAKLRALANKSWDTEFRLRVGKAVI